MKIKVVFSVTFDSFFIDDVQRVWSVLALLSAPTETLHYKGLTHLRRCWIVASLVRCGSYSSLELFSLHNYSSACSNFSSAFTKVRKPWNPPLMINTSQQNGFTVTMDTYCILLSGMPVWCPQSSRLSTGHLQNVAIIFNPAAVNDRRLVAVILIISSFINLQKNTNMKGDTTQWSDLFRKTDGKPDRTLNLTEVLKSLYSYERICECDWTLKCDPTV